MVSADKSILKRRRYGEGGGGESSVKTIFILGPD